MFSRNLIGKMLASFVVFAIGSLAHAACCPAGGAVAAPVSAGCGAPITRTITVNELVPECYETFRTTYRTECVQEAYTAYRTECVPETRTVTRTVVRTVPEWKDVCRTVYKCVPTTETRTVMRRVTRTREVTTMVRKVVDQGHWECQTVPVCNSNAAPANNGRRGLLAGLCKKKKQPEACPCADPCNPCPVECPQYETKKVWVPCKVCVETPCTRTECYTECVPETVCVTVNKIVPTTETHKVCTHRCVTECVPETVTVMTRRCVPYTATRTVSKCVPVQEKVTCTRMVCRPVTKTVVEYPAPACTPTCCEAAPTCCDTCAPACPQEGGKKHGLFRRR